MDGRPGASAAPAAVVAAKRVPATPIRGGPGRTGPSADAIRSARTGSGPQSRSSPSAWTSSRPNAGSYGSVAAGDPRAEGGQRLERALHRGRVRLGVRVEEGRLRDEPVRRPQGHPPPDAELAGRRARVEDRPVRPGLAAEDERAGR